MLLERSSVGHCNEMTVAPSPLWPPHPGGGSHIHLGRADRLEDTYVPHGILNQELAHIAAGSLEVNDADRTSTLEPRGKHSIGGGRSERADSLLCSGLGSSI